MEGLRESNSELFAENELVVDNVWKEYGKVIFNHHNIDQIEGMLFMRNPNTDIQVPSISGDPQIDFAIYQLGSMDYSQFVQQVKNINSIEKQTQPQEQVADAKDFAQLEAEVTPEMRMAMMTDLSHAISEKTTDKDINTERE